MKSYGDARRTLGLIYVGVLSLLLGGLLVGTNLYQVMFPVEGLSDTQYLLLFLLAWVGISFPFDVLGGYVLPHRYGRSIEGFGSWMMKWARGAGVQVLYFFISGWVLLGIGAWLGFWASIGWVVLQMILLGNLQVWVARAIARFDSKPENDRGRLVLYLNNTDKAFTGGIGGLPGNEVLVMPMYWKEKFTEKMLSLLLSRRHGAIQSKSHGRGFLIAFVWNLSLFILASYLGGLGDGSFESIVYSLMYFSLFSLLGLLGPLVRLSRKAVFELDRWAYYKGADADVLRESFDQTYQLRDLPTSSLPISKLSQPVPTKAERLENMQSQQEQKGAWNCAYLAVFLSWGGMNLLARSLPGIAGRPELWVLLPTD